MALERILNKALVPGETKPHVTRREVETMLAACTKPQHRLLLRILWATGARISEIVGDPARKHPPVLTSHVFRRGSNYLLRFHREKRRKESVAEVLLPFDLGLAVDDYRKVLNLAPQQRLFPMDRRGAYAFIRRLGQKALGYKVHPHMFRHGFVYSCLELGIHPYVISALVGHASISSTLSYTHPTEAELLAARERISI